MRKLRILALMHEDHVPPETIEGLAEKQIAPWKAEYDVLVSLDHLGHEARPLGVADDLTVIRDAILEWKPHIVFNLLEDFGGSTAYVPFVLGYFELQKLPYTGCNPNGLMLTSNKAMMRKILRHHRVPMPEFVSFRRGKAVRRPKRLNFPLIVKSPTHHGSVGIAQASVVNSDQKLQERVSYMYDQLQTDVIIEEYIEGRELYVGVLGHRRLETFPTWELLFTNLPEGAPKIATEKVKWDLSYQRRTGIQSRQARELPAGLEDRLIRICKRAYRILGLSGYARIDFRLTPEGRLFLLEPNPNPDISIDEEFCESAKAAGYDYDALIQRIISMGLSYATASRS